MYAQLSKHIEGINQLSLLGDFVVMRCCDRHAVNYGCVNFYSAGVWGAKFAAH